jgi:hypothetical protein
MCGVFAACLLVTLTTTNILQTSIITAICLLALNGLLIFPIGGLFAFHIVLISKGRTTNEHVTGKYKGASFFSRGCCPNMLHLFCGSLTPQYRRVIVKKPKKLTKKKKNNLLVNVDDTEIQNLNPNNGDDVESNAANAQTVGKSKKASSVVGNENELLDLVLKNKKLNKKTKRTSSAAVAGNANDSNRSNNSDNEDEKSVSSSMLNKGGSRHQINMNNTSFDSNKLSTKINSK